MILNNVLLSFILKLKKDEEFRLEEEIPKLPDVKLSQLWLNCKILIGEAILHILDQCSTTDVPEHPPEKVLSACLLIAKITVEKIELEHIPDSLEQSVCFFALLFFLYTEVPLLPITFF